MAKLLICDDEVGIRTVLKRYALHSGHSIEEASNGLEAVELCNSCTFDLIVMDVMMPTLDGLSAVKQIRKNHATPILMLTAKGEEYDRIHAFESGVDDYVIKPFSSKEVMLRIDAILRRTQANFPTQSPKTSRTIYSYESLLVDLDAYKVTIGEEVLAMAPKEYDLLFYLIRNKNIALTREKILSQVWGYEYFGDNRTLDTHMKLLRKSLGIYGKLITTLRGIGYRFDG